MQRLLLLLAAGVFTVSSTFVPCFCTVERRQLFKCWGCTHNTCMIEKACPVRTPWHSRVKFTGSLMSLTQTISIESSKSGRGMRSMKHNIQRSVRMWTQVALLPTDTMSYMYVLYLWHGHIQCEKRHSVHVTAHSLLFWSPTVLFRRLILGP